MSTLLNHFFISHGFDFHVLIQIKLRKIKSKAYDKSSLPLWSHLQVDIFDPFDDPMRRPH